MLPLLLALVAATAQAAPTLIYPLMGQEPPVARVGKPFVFDFLPGTFKSPYNITYTTSSLPAWLSFSPGVETFHGTPSISDVGAKEITVTATDSSGSTAAQWTVLVSNYSVPAVHSSFTTQIANPPLREFSSATTLPGNSGVSVPPYWSFSLGFASDTFRQSRVGVTNGEIYWSARQRGTAGLPSWLSFNNETFTFNGIAPASGTYTIVTTGSDFFGYTGAQTSFVIEVGVGEGIEWVNRSQGWTDIVAMSRGTISHLVDLSKFMMGNETEVASQLTLSLNNTEFPWLSLNPSTNMLSGVVPDQFQNGTLAPYSIPLTIASKNTSNTLALNAYLGLDIVPYLFSAFNIPNATVNPGSSLAFNLAPYLLNSTASVSSNSSNSSLVSRGAPAGTTVSANVAPSEASKWLVFDPNTLQLSGTAPSSADYGLVDVTFTAVQGAYTATSNLNVILAGMSGNGGNGTASINGGGNGGLSQAAKIGLGVGLGLGLLGLILILLALFFCCRKRRKDEEDEKDNDNDSIVASSPVQADPFRRSDPRGGMMSRFQPFAILRTPSQKHNPTSPRSMGTADTAVEKPHRISQLKGILNWDQHVGHDKSPVMATTPQMNRSNSFIAAGDVIGVSPALERPSQDASSFTQSIGTDSSRASWESRRTFQWSSAENESRENNRLSAAPSIPRPRQNFTPRYPRNNSPSKLAELTKNNDPEASPEFSEFDSQDGHSPRSPGLGSPTMTGSTSFPAGPSGLSRFGESGHFGTDDEGDHTGDEGPAVVAMAERQSFETRQPRTASTEQPVPRLRPSRERISQVEQRRRERSERALSGEQGAFDDAEELKRASTYAPSTNGGGTEVQGLYAGSEIYFASPQPDKRFSGMTNASTIQRVSQMSSPLSPPLPQVGSFVRPRPNSGGHGPRLSGTANAEGRIIAVANETFSTHPQIHPPPTVSLSAATWSSNPPSTYRAVAEHGIPPWLHFDSKALELWGVPGMAHVGEITVIRILEKLPQDKRRSDPAAFGYQPPQEREVGVISIEVVDRLKSPQFALDGSPHAL